MITVILRAAAAAIVSLAVAAGAAQIPMSGDSGTSVPAGAGTPSPTTSPNGHSWCC